MKKYLLVIALIGITSVAQGQNKADTALWNSINASNRISDFDQYLKQQDKGSFRKSAEKKIKEITDKELKEWEKLSNSMEKAQLQEFKKKCQVDSVKSLVDNKIRQLGNSTSTMKLTNTQSKNKSEDINIDNKKRRNPLLIPFLISLLLLVGLIFLLIKLFKKMDKKDSKSEEIKISLSEKLDKYKDTITSFNAVLKALGKDEQLKTNINPLENAISIDKLLSNLEIDFNSIAKQAKKLESEYEERAKINGLPREQFSVMADALRKKLTDTEKELAELKALKSKDVELIITNYEVPKDTYINTNILVSAGPRKDKDNDTELGEDATGILNTPKGTYFWILDGTSDSPSVKSEENHIFSSRVLAQTMNANIRDLLVKQKNKDVSLKDILTDAVDHTKQLLMQKIQNASTELHQIIGEAVKNGNNPYCSTTVALGFLAKNGALNYFYLGDSEILSFKNISNSLQANPRDENPNPSRLFISIVAEDGKMIFKTNPYQEKLVSYTKDNVDYVVAFSDGIGVSEKSILENPQSEIAQIATTNQKTFDDKSLIILERIKYS